MMQLAQRYKILGVMNDDIYAADEFYHKQCYNHFVDIPTSVEGEGTTSNEMNISSEKLTEKLLEIKMHICEANS